MIKRKFKAKMVDDFKKKWLEASAVDQGSDIETEEGFYGGFGLDALHERISGQVVTIVEHEYEVGDNDFFEEVDNNFVIFPSLFEELNT